MQNCKAEEVLTAQRRIVWKYMSLESARSGPGQNK